MSSPARQSRVPVNINAATIPQLKTLTGIGSSRAKHILKARSNCPEQRLTEENFWAISDIPNHILKLLIDTDAVCFGSPRRNPLDLGASPELASPETELKSPTTGTSSAMREPKPKLTDNAKATPSKLGATSTPDAEKESVSGKSLDLTPGSGSPIGEPNPARLEKVVRDLNNENDILMNDNEALTNDYARIKAQNEQLVAECEDYIKKNGSLIKEKSSMEDKLQFLQTRIDQQDEQLNSYAHMVLEKDVKLGEQEKKHLQEIGTVKRDLKAKILEATAEKETVEREHQTWVHDSEQKLSAMQERFQAEVGKVAASQSDSLFSLHQEKKDLITENNDLQKVQQKLEDDLTTAQVKVKKLTWEKEKLDIEKSNLESKMLEYRTKNRRIASATVTDQPLSLSMFGSPETWVPSNVGQPSKVQEVQCTSKGGQPTSSITPPSDSRYNAKYSIPVPEQEYVNSSWKGRSNKCPQVDEVEVEDDDDDDKNDPLSDTIERNLVRIQHQAPHGVYKAKEEKGVMSHQVHVQGGAVQNLKSPPPPTRVTKPPKHSDLYNRVSAIHGNSDRTTQNPYASSPYSLEHQQLLEYTVNSQIGDRTTSGNNNPGRVSWGVSPPRHQLGNDRHSQQNSSQSFRPSRSGTRSNLARNPNDRDGYDSPDDYGRGNRQNDSPHPRRRYSHSRSYSFHDDKPKRDPKMTIYKGTVSWRAYEVKLDHMALKYGWDDSTKLAKLVEALEGEALTCYSTLHAEERDIYQLVRAKFNARFGPKPPSRTARNQLSIVEQNPDEKLEEFAERAQRLAMDAWGDLSVEMARASAMEAFLHGAQDKQAAITTMEKSPVDLDQALLFLKETIHNRQSLMGRSNATKTSNKTYHSVNWPDDENLVREVKVPKDQSPRLSKLEEEMKSLKDAMLEVVKSLKDKKAPNRGCFTCGSLEHFARECPNKSSSPRPRTPPRLSEGNSPRPSPQSSN